MRRFGVGPNGSDATSPERSAVVLRSSATNGILMRSPSRSTAGTLALAGCRSGWLRSRCSGPKLPRQTGRRAAPAQTHSQAGAHPAGSDHRQAQVLRRGTSGSRAEMEHRQHKGLNNRAENSHQPTRRRERIMKRFKSARHVQRFVSIHDPIANLFHFPRHYLTSADYRTLRSEAMVVWSEVTGIRVVA